jgi:hypothetical protein
MDKRKEKKDKQLSTKHTHQSNIEQHNTLILSLLKYIRGTSSYKPGLFNDLCSVHIGSLLTIFKKSQYHWNRIGNDETGYLNV